VHKWSNYLAVTHLRVAPRALDRNASLDDNGAT
jgi:hypothetical protein